MSWKLRCARHVTSVDPDARWEVFALDSTQDLTMTYTCDRGCASSARGADCKTTDSTSGVAALPLLVPPPLPIPAALSSAR